MQAPTNSECPPHPISATLPLDRVRDLLNRNGREVTTLTADLISGGRSNLTYRLTAQTPAGQRIWVLRRPPLGHVLATAHDMSREFRVISALAGTDVPVPGTILMCDDPTVLGSPFFVMEHARGEIIGTDQAVLSLGPSAEALGKSLVGTLAALHRLDPDTIGLADFGRPHGFMERQVRRWTAQLNASRSRDLDDVEELAADLAGSIPEQAGAALIHGDFRLDNCLVADGRVAAVLDWEMSTLGDPLADLALFAVYTGGFSDIEQNVIHSPAGIGAFPTTETLVTTYAAISGQRITHFGWYLGFAWFKLAVILEGIHYRSVIGKSTGDEFQGVDALVPYAIERGRAALGSPDWRS